MLLQIANQRHQTIRRSTAHPTERNNWGEPIEYNFVFLEEGRVRKEEVASNYLSTKCFVGAVQGNQLKRSSFLIKTNLSVSHGDNIVCLEWLWVGCTY